MSNRSRIAWLWRSLFALLTLTPATTAAQEKLTLPGLAQPVEILRDRWGVSHIYAQNELDLFFAQGFSAARDRLFQLELWRRQATGTLAKIQGPKAFLADIGARLLRFRGDMKRELNHYHPHGSAIISAFVAGINAYIELTEREPARLPLEFKILGIKPGQWTPEIVVSRHNGLFRNATYEVQLAQLVHIVGAERTRELVTLHPGRPRLEPDPLVDLASIKSRILDLYQASRAPIRFQPEDVEPAYCGRDRGGRKSASLTGSDQTLASVVAHGQELELVGSNNWVLSPKHAALGSAIMANDPHRTVQLPSLRYWVHLVAPGWNVIGAGEPALPGVSVGHNERGAWGFTIFPIDQEDLFVYETDPSDPSRYQYRGRWDRMTTIADTIGIKGQLAVEIELRFTRHGPVVYLDQEQHKAYALRAAWLEEGTAPYLASLRLDQATTWAEFREACRFFLMPSENMVWADVDGHIGWQAVGLAPRRENWDGLIPVPGDGRFEWNGFLPVLDLPHVADPPRGWFASANQDNLPPAYPFAVGFLWSEPFRFARIEEVLGSKDKFTLAEMTQLQHDELSLPARSLVPLLRELKPADASIKQAIDQLSSWNFALSRDSTAAAIYVVWERSLKAAVWNVMVPSEAQGALPFRLLSTTRLIEWLKTPDGRFGRDPAAGRDALLLGSLATALSELERHFGPERDRWRYGQAGFKHVQLKHPLSDAVTAELRSKLDLGPLPRGGYGHTVNSTSDDFNQSTGASFRIVADTGGWDRSLGTNTPGQSGDPESPHYHDLFEPWADGRYFPVVFTRSKVEEATEMKTSLAP